MKKTIGILGGMGPMATVDLFHKIVEQTPATVDQEHIKILIYNNPQIPSRNNLGNKEAIDPFWEMSKSVKLLENSGADFIIFPCHAAHYWLPSLREQVKIPIYSMIDITLDYVINRHADQSILLLANTTTIQKKIYEQPGRSIKFIPLEPREQELVVALINSIKSNTFKKRYYIEDLNNLLDNYYKKGISVLVGGCSEIPLIFPLLNKNFIKIDPTLLLAKEAIRLASED